MFLQSLSTAGTNKPDVNDFPAFAEKYLRIRDFKRRLMPLRLNPIQVRYLRERGRRNLIQKSRHVGITTVKIADQAHLAWFSESATLAVGKDQDNLDNIRMMWQTYYNNLPADMRPARKYDNKSLVTLPDVGSYQVMVKVGSNGAGRSFTFRDIFLDECAYYAVSLTDAIAAVGSTGDPDRIDAASTTNGASGDFFDMCMTAIEDPKFPWKHFFFPWWELPAYALPLLPGEPFVPDDEEAELMAKHGLTPEQINWRRHKMAEMMIRENFLQEFPEDPVTCFKLSGNGFFGNIEHAFKGPGEDVETEPIEGDVYVGGMDWGQVNDNTTLRIRNRRTMKSVAALRINREDWSVMRREALALCKKWGVKLLWAEENSASSNVEDLKKERYPGLRVKAVKMTFHLKRDLANSFRAALHEKRTTIFDTPTARAEFRSAVSKETEEGWTVKFPRNEDGHGDDAMAELLSYGAAQDYVQLDTSVEAGLV